METNKLLTLEEIEEIQYDTDKIGDNIINPTWANVPISQLNALLALGRAYHELAKESIEDEKCYVETLWQDKPHLPTLRVIVEAMKGGVGMVWEGDYINGTRQVFTPTNVIQSLEKHLE